MSDNMADGSNVGVIASIWSALGAMFAVLAFWTKFVTDRIGDARGIAAAGEGCMATIEMPEVHPLIAPLVYAVPVQLLAYHVAVLKGTDVDQPRNLAKSVTVE